ncbi:MAG TPA: AI-2E family transporter, partial [Janthinobacterium sp.]|nr:AI-2E family transporter [Janthinobacterium sp.]
MTSQPPPVPPESAANVPAEAKAEAEPKGEPTSGAAPENTGAHGGSLSFPLHVNARGLALGIIASVSFLYAVQWSQKFLIPLLLGIFLAYTLNPVVVWLQRLRLPRVLGATLVMLMILAGSVGVINAVQGEFQSIVEELPEAT